MRTRDARRDLVAEMLDRVDLAADLRAVDLAAEFAAAPSLDDWMRERCNDLAAELAANEGGTDGRHKTR